MVRVIGFLLAPALAAFVAGCSGGGDGGEGQPQCVPACGERQCGGDGCGGSCGECEAPWWCEEESGQCVECVPDCEGKTCGDDGCGGTCGECGEGWSCSPYLSKCVGGCTGDCTDRECGDDGCGGSCGICGEGDECDGAGRCGPAASCTDGQKNGTESDVDCGGSCPDRCPAGKTCSRGTDCKSEKCEGGTCREDLTCMDVQLSPGETDVDCGGPKCSPCALTKFCKEHSDCLTKACVFGVCSAPTCDDGWLNQDESDVDCGGVCKDCPDGKACHGGDDCTGGGCEGGTCCSANGCGECTSTPDEVCDGKDNDCDGKTDETPDIGQGEPCENQKGVCQGSRKQCKGGKWVCNAATLEDWKWQYETTETECDDLDNDCDGQTDEPAECCEPQCDGKDCGPDACGGECGSCGDGFCMGSDCVDKGYEAWSFLVEGYTITSTPAVAADGTVFVTTDFPFQLVAIKPDGSEKWSVTAPQDDSFGHHVAGPNGVVVVRTTNGVAGYGAAYGNLKWVSGYALDDFVLWPDGGIVGTMKGGADEYKLVALDGDGLERWTVQLGSAADMWFWSHPVIGSDGTVYIGAPDRKLHAVTDKGKEKWTSKELGTLDDGAAAIAADGTIYVGTGDIMDEGGGPLYALAPANGSVKWTYDTGEGVAAWPVVGPDGTIVVAVPGGVQAVTPAGKKKWACDVGDNVYEAPAVTRHGIVLVGAYGKVVAVDPDGKVMWEFQTGVDSPLVLDSDGYLYVNYSTGSGSHLRVLDVSSGAGSPWPMWAHDARLAGLFTGADGAAPW